MTETSYDVKVWAVKTYERKAGRTYRARWTVAGQERHKTFRTRALADGFRAELLTAARRGQPFDLTTGIPQSRSTSLSEVSWLPHARAFVDANWSRWAPRSRQSAADALASVTMALLPDTADRPPQAAIRRALARYAFTVVNRAGAVDEPDGTQQALAWVEHHSPPLATLNDITVVRRLLDALARNLDGRPAAANTVVRRRAVLHAALAHAVEVGHLPANPLERVRWRRPRNGDAVELGVVVNHDQARRLLDAVAEQGPRGPHYVAFFACMYYAALRPAEVVNLRRQDVRLPDDLGQWGELRLSASDPNTSPHWTDDGARGPRQLKHRSPGAVRPVPCPPPLVVILTRHLEQFGAGPGGRLFINSHGGTVAESTYSRTWAAARRRALTPEEEASPLARRPYDLRHAAVSTWLSAGADPAIVAEWAGHSVAVLLRVYAKAVSGRDEHARSLIGRVLNDL
jgi:integrase